MDAPILWRKNNGRNGWDPVIEVGPASSVESRNVFLYKGGLGTRRGGSKSIAIVGVTAPILAIFEYVQTSLASSELWIVDSGSPTLILRCAGGSTFTSQTLADAITGNAVSVSAAVLNQKHYLAYQSGVNRIHVFDPNNASANTVRRGGLAPFAAGPTVANTGSGSYANTGRYYRTRSIEQQTIGGVTVVNRRSEASPSSSLFTPSGTGLAARVTRPTAVGEGETHWEVYGSTDGVTFYGPLGTVAIATTTYDDSSDPTTWATTLTAAPSTGTYTPFPSVKCLGSTGTRLYGFGVWETATGNSVTPKNGRFYFGPALDATTTADDERINNTTSLQGWIDIARNAGGVDRGCTPTPVNNVIYCFQDRGVYGLYPTENDTTPYRRVVFSTRIGNIAQQAIVIAIDRGGNPCCYFADPVLGPYAIGGLDGLRWCGKDVADIWATVNKDATTLVACSEWYPDRSEIIFLVAINGSNTPNFALTLDPTRMTLDSQGDLRGGWTTGDGDFFNSCAIRLFSNTLNATRSATRVPYTGGASKLLRYDETVNQDDAANFKGFVTSGAQAVEHHAITVEKAFLIASAQSGVSVQQSFIRNTGDQTNRTSSVTLTPVSSETTLLKKFADAALNEAWCFQVTLGDAAAQNVAWQFHQWRARVSADGAEF